MRIDVEKLARALAERFYDDDIWDGMPSIVQGNWSHVAKKASALVLEEAAKVCEGVVSNDPNCVLEAAYKHVADEHATAIRALAKGGE